MVSDLAVAMLTLVGGGGLLKICFEQIGQKDELEEHQTAYDGRKQQPNDKEPAHQPNRPLVRLVRNRFARKFGFSHDIHVMHFLQLPIVPNSVTARRPDEKQLRLR